MATDTKIRLEQGFKDHGEYRLVCTVRHTGSHSLLEMYPWPHWHCNRQAWEIIKDNPCRVLTTYRDPLRTAASWFNRDQLDVRGGEDRWCSEWYYYGKIKPYAEIYPVEALDFHLYTSKDKYNLHKALDEGDIDYFYSKVDKELIDYANEQIRTKQTD